ncbi:MAG: hypothetical protein WAQ08_21675 [Aquabacterium sp.]|uniref:hypothetical protein n=1 Tax=Aquabacterium sp. TaxID=1872578 RepID=UPI003BAE6754
MTIAARNPIVEAIARVRAATPDAAPDHIREEVAHQLGIPEDLVAEVLDPQPMEQS